MGKPRRRGVQGGGTLRRYETGAGIRWSYLVYVQRDPTRPELGRRRIERGGFPTAKAADAALRNTIAADRAGVRVASTPPTVAAYAETWLASLDLTASTVRGYRGQLTRHVVPRIGALTLDGITPTVINTLLKDLASVPAVPAESGRWQAPKVLGANTIRKIATTLGAMLDAAVADGHLAANPAKHRAVRRPSGSRVTAEAPEMVTWTEAQVAAFLAWSRDHGDADYPLWLLYAATGARRSELLAVRWGDVDLPKRVITIRRALDTDTPGEVKKPKSGRSRRVEITAPVAAELGRWRALLASRHLDLARPNSWVFPTPGHWDRPRNPRSVSAVFARRVAWAQADLGGEDVLPTLHLHGLRHTAATILITNGVDPATVADRLGHTSTRITLDVYSHVTADSSRRAAELLSFV